MHLFSSKFCFLKFWLLIGKVVPHLLPSHLSNFTTKNCLKLIWILHFWKSVKYFIYIWEKWYEVGSIKSMQRQTQKLTWIYTLFSELWPVRSKTWIALFDIRNWRHIFKLSARFISWFVKPVYKYRNISS